MDKKKTKNILTDFTRFCSRSTDACQVDSVSRTNCKKCRLNKCLENGMRPEKVDRVRKKRIKAEAEEVKTEAIKIEAVKTEELDEMYDESDSSAADEFDVAMLRTTELVPMEPLEPTQVLVGSVDPSYSDV